MLLALRLRRWIGAGLCCLGLAGCVDAVRQAPATYVVQSHDTLYSIAWRHNLDYRELARWNRLGSNYRISVGQVLRLDVPGGPAPAQRPSSVQRSMPPSADQGGTATSIPVSAWVWPTEHSGVPRSTPGGGILLPGRLGQEVRAASGGRVVYTGNGLRGYGNLIILKHADSLLSAYAFNSQVLVQEGQEVTPGELIARMGLGGDHTPALYFEVRQNGKAIDPMTVLHK